MTRPAPGGHRRRCRHRGSPAGRPTTSSTGGAAFRDPDARFRGCQRRSDRRPSPPSATGSPISATRTPSETDRAWPTMRSNRAADTERDRHWSVSSGSTVGLSWWTSSAITYTSACRAARSARRAPAWSHHRVGAVPKAIHQAAGTHCHHRAGGRFSRSGASASRDGIRRWGSPRPLAMGCRRDPRFRGPLTSACGRGSSCRASRPVRFQDRARRATGGRQACSEDRAEQQDLSGFGEVDKRVHRVAAPVLEVVVRVPQRLAAAPRVSRPREGSTTDALAEA